MNAFSLRKFVPAQPIVFPAIASQIAILEGKAPGAVLQFYFQLAAWRRDIDSMLKEIERRRGGPLTGREVQFLARRIHQTRRPGLRALESMSTLVDEPNKIDAEAITAYDELRDEPTPEGTLRERIGRLIA